MKENIKEEIGHQARKSYPASIRVPKELQNLVLNAKKEKLTIHTIRIVVCILARIKFRQIDRPEQLSLFSDQFFTEADSLVKFTFKYKDFLPDNYTNIKPIKEAFRFLENYQNEYHQIINKKGEKLEVGGGLIMGKPTFNTTKKEVIFHMNSYWYDKFLNLSENFNEHLLNLFFNTGKLNTKIMYSYLTTLPDKGTKAHIDTLNKKFGTRYGSYSEFTRSLLNGIKLELDKVADISFNITKSESNKQVMVVTPYLTNNEPKTNARPKDLEYSRIKRKVIYLKGKHDLDDVQAAMLKTVFRKHGFDNINYVISKNKKSWSKNVKGEDFMNLFTAAYTGFLKVFSNKTKEF